VRTPLPRRVEQHALDAGREDRRPGELEAWSFALERRLPFAVLDRGSVGVDSRVEGPAILLEGTATTYLDAGFTARVHPSGSLLVDGGGA
jgi:N-methylhydantoinase A